MEVITMTTVNIVKDRYESEIYDRVEISNISFDQIFGSIIENLGDDPFTCNGVMNYVVYSLENQIRKNIEKVEALRDEIQSLSSIDTEIPMENIKRLERSKDVFNEQLFRNTQMLEKAKESFNKLIPQVKWYNFRGEEQTFSSYGAYKSKKVNWKMLNKQDPIYKKIVNDFAKESQPLLEKAKKAIG
jgi:hypothetical protein